VFLLLVLGMLWLARKDRAPHSVQTWVTILLVVVIAQAAVGYVQYFSDVPALLVGVHVAGATAVFTATLCLYLSMFTLTPRSPAPESPVSPEEGVLTAS